MNPHLIKVIVAFVESRAPEEKPIMDQIKCIGLEEMLSPEGYREVYFELNRTRAARELVEKVKEPDQ